MNLAGIDIGTNSLRLLIADITNDIYHEIYSDRHVTRLGKNLDHTGQLTPDAEEHTLHVLQDYARAIKRHAVVHTSAVGTSALRNASNATSFLSRVQTATGIAITVISGEEEARLTLRGLSHSLDNARDTHTMPILAGPAMVVDIGGGSTELILIRPGARTLVTSLPLGAVYLTERYIRHDPPKPDELLRIQDAVCGEFDALEKEYKSPVGGVLIGTAGTITTLSSVNLGLVQYDSEKITNSQLAQYDIRRIISQLSIATNAERQLIPGLEKGREDILLAGTIIAQEIMKRYNYEEMLVSDWGLREGIVLDLYDRLSRTGPVDGEKGMRHS